MVEENILWLDQEHDHAQLGVWMNPVAGRRSELGFGSIMSDLWTLGKLLSSVSSTLRLVNKIYTIVADEMK